MFYKRINGEKNWNYLCTGSILLHWYYIDFIFTVYVINFFEKKKFPNLYIGVIVTLYLNKIQGFFSKCLLNVLIILNKEHSSMF